MITAWSFSRYSTEEKSPLFYDLLWLLVLRLSGYAAKLLFMVMLMLDVDTDADTKTDIYADAGCLVRLDGGPPSTLKKG